MRFRGWIALALAAGATNASAQVHPLDQLEVAYAHDTGLLHNESAQQRVLASFPVQVDGATWLRLYFDDVQLAGPRGESFLRVTSLLDGAVQQLDAATIQEWYHSTAYFNGDAVLVELVAGPASGPHRLSLERADTGIFVPPPESQCGPVDDRIPSGDPRVARLVPIGCTGWIIDDCMHCLMTAGHCNGSTNQIAQFNVPLSDPSSGSLNHPPPQDQYSIDFSSKQGVNGGIGNDWGTFGVFSNPNTGLTPVEAQGAFFILDFQAPPFDPTLTIRITGHGTDSTPPERNQVQQFHQGPYFENNLAGTFLRYVVDTTGGNSGSPVIDTRTGHAIGVHTHAGCSTTGTGGNHGTAAENAGWLLARANPQGVCNPGANCVQVATAYCQGKQASTGCVPYLGFEGAPSATSTDAFLMRAWELVPNEAGVFLYSSNGRANLNFHAGKLCVKAPFVRLLPAINASQSGYLPCLGRATVNFNNRIQNGTDPMLVPGHQVNVQFRQRDPSDPTGFGDVLTNAIEFIIQP